MSLNDRTRVTLRARLRSLPRDEALDLTQHEIHWDGVAFSVAIEQFSLAPRSTSAGL
jgi:hypothetical protein